MQRTQRLSMLSSGVNEGFTQLVHVFVLQNNAHSTCIVPMAMHSRNLANLFWCPWSKCHMFLLIPRMDVYHRVSWCCFVGSSTSGTPCGTSCDSTCESFRCRFLSLSVNLCFDTVRHASDLLGCVGGRRQERFRLNAASATPSACFHSVSTDVSCSRRSLSLYFFFVHLSIGQTNKQETKRFVAHALCQFSHCTFLQNMHVHPRTTAQLLLGSVARFIDMCCATSCII